MPEYRQLSFSKGEIDPALHARVDTVAYSTGLATCRNSIIKKQGGLANRPGTQYVNEVKTSSLTVRLIDFVFNDDQSYVLEFGNLYMRVYRAGARVDVSGLSAWNSGTAYIAGNVVSHSGTNYVCILASTNNTPPNSTYWYALSGTIFEIPTPYATANLPDLKYTQSADSMVIVHPSYAPKELKRLGHASWSLASIVFGATITGPTNVFPDGGSIPPWNYYWAVTAVKNGEESIVSDTARSLLEPTVSVPIVLSWASDPTVDSFRIYRKYQNNGAYGFVGTSIQTSSGNSFTDDGIEPDFLDTPPTNPGLFASSGNYPSAVAYAQQCLFFGGSTNKPETIWKSKVGFPKNFNVKTPINDDSPVTATIPGKKVSRILNLTEYGKLISLTSGGESILAGNVNGSVTPTDINAHFQSYHGSNGLRPIEADLLLYIQSRGSIVRGFEYSVNEDRYDGPDLSLLSAHLLQGHTIVDWAYQTVPNSIIWVVRDDGVLLGFTFVKEHEILAWHRHDTDGVVENVCVIPEDDEDSLYLVVKRTINGTTKRYIERMYTRQVDDIVDSVFMDCALSYDGRNTGSQSMTLSGGSTWKYSETLTLTSSTSFFTAGDVGNEIHLTGSDGTLIRFRITGYTSGTVVTGHSDKTVPSVMRSVAITDWARAVDEISGLDHLEGKQVSVFADGFVVASPNNSDYSVLTVTSGAITLTHPYAVIHVGLPITADVETLDIDSSGRSTLINKQKLITEIYFSVEKTRGVFSGPTEPEDDSTEGLREVMVRENENYDDPVELTTGRLNVFVPGEWNSSGRVFLRQVDPLPMSILAIVPVGQIGG